MLHEVRHWHVDVVRVTPKPRSWCRQVQADSAKRKSEASKKRKDQDKILGTGRNGKREKISFKMSL